ncbi:MAG: rhomboid family intramembrane serine protease [Bacteroidetes bacterium]|nr:MAG: rhomboid family intramembrane serine protease [Bacteroidota bacterium]
MRLKYNSPVILTYTLLCTVILAIEQFTPLHLMDLFTVFPEVNLTSPVWYFRLVSHVMGHGNWEHLVGNFTLILLIGPILEEKYGSRDLIWMIFVTALITGLLQIFFFHAALLGASGVAFMMILLSSFTNSRGGIPLTFVLVVVLFLGKEILGSFGEDNVSQFAHIIGGVLGGLFGFILEGGQRKKTSGSSGLGL